MGRVSDNHTHSAAKTHIEQHAAQPLRPHTRAAELRPQRCVLAPSMGIAQSLHWVYLQSGPARGSCPTAVRKTHTDPYLTWGLEGP